MRRLLLLTVTGLLAFAPTAQAGLFDTQASAQSFTTWSVQTGAGDPTRQFLAVEPTATAIRFRLDPLPVGDRDGIEATNGCTQEGSYAALCPLSVNGLVTSFASGDDRLRVDPAITARVNAVGGNGADDLQGGSGPDAINAGAGNDIVRGMAGNDILENGAGADLFDGDGPGTTGGLDTLEYIGSAPVRVTQGDPGTPEATEADDGAKDEGDTVLPSVEVILFGSGNDQYSGNGADNKALGSGGGDQLFGGAGRDELDGGPGDDEITGGPGVDTILSGLGADRINAKDGEQDTIDCGAGDQDVVVHDPEDILAGNCFAQPASNAPPPAAGGGDTAEVTEGPGAPPASTEAGCSNSVLVGPVTVRAECFKPDEATQVAAGPQRVRFAGLDLLVPEGGRVVADPANLLVSFEGQITVKAGDTVLYTGSLPTIPLKALKFELDTSKNAKLKGFPIQGKIKVAVVQGGAEIDLTVELPKELQLPGVTKGITGSAKLFVNDATGLRLDNLKVEAPVALLGPVELRNIKIAYDRAKKGWTGGGSIVLPLPEPRPEIGGSVGFADGQLTSASAKVGGLNLPIGKGVFLQRIEFGIAVKPLTIQGGIGISAGPKVLGVEAVSADGKFSIRFSKPVVIRIDGELRIAQLQNYNGFIEYRTDGQLSLGLGFSYGIPDTLALEGSVKGFIDRDVAYNLEGSVDATILAWKPVGAKVLVSSKGIGACGNVKVWEDVSVSVGFAKGWGKGIEIFGLSCDLSGYRVVARASAAQAGDGRTVKVGRGEKVVSFAVRGSGAPPALEVKAPDGTTVSSGSGAVTTKKALLVTHADTDTTYVVLRKPAAGNWKLTPKAGSPGITSVRQATGLPKPSVRAQVTGTGAKRTLRYSLKPIPGQTVSFVGAGGRALGKARGAAGTLSFTPAAGGGKQSVTAVVEQYGTVRERLKVATFSPPRPVTVGKPGKITVKRTNGGASVTWKAAKGAAKYAVTVDLSDGRRLLFVERRRSLTISGLAAGTRGAVRVTGLTEDGRSGRPTTARLEAAR